MCRFALYLGPPVSLGALLTQPTRSLLEQARHSELGLEPVNGDGCGAAWYTADGPRSPRLFRDASPAWNSAAWHQLAAAQQGHCILAHVRAATENLAVTLENCHPFAWRRLAFMHNGNLPELARILPALRSALSPRARNRVRGTTDSEHIFALLADHWLALEAAAPLERLAGAVRATLGTLEDLRRACGIEAPAYLNLAVADGRRAVVSRHTSTPEQAAHSLYVRNATRAQDDAAPGVVVASEPLDREAGWEAVPDDHLVQVAEGGGVSLAPLREHAEERVA